MKNLIDIDLAKATFSYSPETGLLTKKIGRKPKNGIVGTVKISGTAVSKRTYLRVYLGGSKVYVHRLIWSIVTGEQPNEIDHIDGDGLNNKWGNLRSVSHGLNGKNQKIHATNTSGSAGVCYRKDSGKWRARIMVDGEMISLGSFPSKSDAVGARQSAEIQHGFGGNT